MEEDFLDSDKTPVWPASVGLVLTPTQPQRPPCCSGGRQAWDSGRGEVHWDAGGEEGQQGGGPEGTDPCSGCSPNKPPNALPCFQIFQQHYIQKSSAKSHHQTKGAFLVNLDPRLTFIRR